MPIKIVSKSVRYTLRKYKISFKYLTNLVLKVTLYNISYGSLFFPFDLWQHNLWESPEVAILGADKKVSATSGDENDHAPPFIFPYF